MQRQRDARLRCKVAAPHPAAVHHHVGRNMPWHAIGVDVIDARGPPARFGNTCHLGMFKNLRAAHPRPLGQRHRDIARIALTIQRQVHSPHHV